MNNLVGPRLRPLEELIVFTPLGVRFWDAALDQAITGGLIVRARRQAAPTSVAVATVTPAGVFAFHHLPGLRDIEYPRDRLLRAVSPVATHPFIVDVEDQERRFVPVVFTVDAPHLGIFPVRPSISPGGDGPPGFYLFSAATRTPSPGLAVVRVTLRERVTRSAAAHAVLELRLPAGPRHFAVADADGQAAFLFPYPLFVHQLSSPLQSSLAAREQANWAVNVRVRYEPALHVRPLPELSPNLSNLLAQARAPVWPHAAGPPLDEVGETLTFGRELILRTDQEPVLLVG